PLASANLCGPRRRSLNGSSNFSSNLPTKLLLSSSVPCGVASEKAASRCTPAVPMRVKWFKKLFLGAISLNGSSYLNELLGFSFQSLSLNVETPKILVAVLLNSELCVSVIRSTNHWFQPPSVASLSACLANPYS